MNLLVPLDPIISSRKSGFPCTTMSIKEAKMDSNFGLKFVHNSTRKLHNSWYCLELAHTVFNYDICINRGNIAITSPCQGSLQNIGHKGKHPKSADASQEITCWYQAEDSDAWCQQVISWLAPPDKQVFSFYTVLLLLLWRRSEIFRSAFLLHDPPCSATWWWIT